MLQHGSMPIRLSIKIWPSGRRAVCREPETCPSEGSAARPLRWPPVSRWDQPERKLPWWSDCCAPTIERLSGCLALLATRSWRRCVEARGEILVYRAMLTFSICGLGVTPQNVCDAPSAERLTASVHKKLGRSDRPANSQPGSERHSRRLPKRQCSFSTALAKHADTCRLGRNIVDAQPCQFRNSEPCAHREMQHGSIPDSLPRGWIRSVEQGLRLFLDQKRYQPSEI